MERDPADNAAAIPTGASADRISYAEQIHRLAEADPDRIAITCGEETITRGELARRADDLAADLAVRGVEVGDMVTVALSNSIDWFVAYAAIWRLGAIPQPTSARLPLREIRGIVELADSAVVIGLDEGAIPGRICLPAGYRAPEVDALDLPFVASPAWKAPTSGGSTGAPKLIVSSDPAEMDPGEPDAFGIGSDGCLVMPGPLYHNGPAVWTCAGWLQGAHVVLLPRFDAEATLAAIAEHGGTVLYMVPTMMKRIWRLPVEVRERYDLSTLRLVWHLAEPCPEWLKQAWIDWLGPERIIELFASTESHSATVITGTEWLEHRGSVGRPMPGTVEITDEHGAPVPAGIVGEIWQRSATGAVTYRYIGAEPRSRPGGWESVGDMGHLDEDGYLYLGDRAGDMILSGGANIYPAEIESALQEHPAVASCAIIGLPDEDRGNRVHAIVQPEAGAEIDEGALTSFLEERLVRYKVPRTFEFVTEALRDDAGKVRRAQLRRDRLSGQAAAESG